MFASRRSRILAVLLTGAAVWSPLAAGDCMLDFERSKNEVATLMHADLPVHSTTPEVSLAVAAGPARQQGRISADCTVRDVINVELRMMPGEQVRFYVLRDRNRRLVVDQASTSLTSGDYWILVPVRTGMSSIPSTVYPTGVDVRVPVDYQPGNVLEAQLRLEGRDSDEGPTQINLRLEVIEEGPLFRDDFGVDPVLGQFSFFEPVGSPLDDQETY